MRGKKYSQNYYDFQLDLRSEIIYNIVTLPKLINLKKIVTLLAVTTRPNLAVYSSDQKIKLTHIIFKTRLSTEVPDNFL